MKTIALLACILAPTAFADFKIGTYHGLDSETSAPCAINFKAKNFVDNVRHPLNELVEVEVNWAGEKRSFTLRHPAAMNRETGQVSVVHDYLESMVAYASGVSALSVHIVHGQGAEGPQSYVLSIRDRKDHQKSLWLSCQGLHFPAR